MSLGVFLVSFVVGLEHGLGYEFGVEYDELDEFGGYVCCVFVAYRDVFDEFGGVFDEFGRGLTRVWR